MNVSATNIGGVVVTYFPSIDFGQRLAAIAREVGPLIVVDNSGVSLVQDGLRALCAAVGCELILNLENLGLATALNQAFRRHAETGLAWVIAFDQDSTPEKGLAAALLAAATTGLTPGRRPAAVIGSNWHDEARPGSSARYLQAKGLWFTRRPATEDLVDVTCVITSGTLFHLPPWRALGGFDETLFLDLVDTDYCLRLRTAGHRIAVAAAARLAHRRGAKRAVRRLGWIWWPAFMPPVRLLYLSRNRMRLFRRHAARFPHWMAFELAYAAKIIAEILFLEDNKIAKLAAIARGTWHGLLGRGGRWPNPPT